MARERSSFVCTDCGSAHTRWLGRCPSCGAWNTLEGRRAGPRVSAGPDDEVSPVPLSQVDMVGWVPRPTGLGELDRVLGGGLVPGSVTLIGGEPGVGKSTLVLQTAAAVAASGVTVLYTSAEESRQQVRVRAERFGAIPEAVLLSSETRLPGVLEQVESLGPGLCVVDSIQTVGDPALDSPPGSLAQVRHCAGQLVAIAKQKGVAVLLVGHVTKDGAIAGPRVLEHVVDTVLTIEGDGDRGLRFLRAAKHRFGPTHDVGVLEMGPAGLRCVDDPSELFLTDRRPGLPGSVVVPTLDGNRPLLVELQSLTAPARFGAPTRSAHGVDRGRLGFLLAVLSRRAGLDVTAHDVYALAVGGTRVAEPAGDLGLALAVASARVDVAMPAEVVACAEVGLAGELRQVAQVERRLAEAARLGFRRAVVAESTASDVPGISTIRAANLRQVLDLLGLESATGGARAA